MGMPGQPVSNLQANAYVNRRGEEEMAALLDRAARLAGPAEHGPSYAAGVEAALTWAFGMSNDEPLRS